MKKTHGLHGLTRTLLVLSLLTSAPTFGQMSYVDTTTAHSVTNTTTGGKISIPGVITNAAFAMTNPVTSLGDPLATAFGKVNMDIYWLFNFVETNDFGGGGALTNGNYIVTTNGTGSNLTITNTFTLVNTNPVYFIDAIVFTNLYDGWNGTYYADPAIAPYAMSNANGYIVFIIPSSTNTTLVTNQVYSPNYSFTSPNFLRVTNTGTPADGLYTNISGNNYPFFNDYGGETFSYLIRTFTNAQWVIEQKFYTNTGAYGFEVFTNGAYGGTYGNTYFLYFGLNTNLVANSTNTPPTVVNNGPYSSAALIMGDTIYTNIPSLANSEIVTNPAGFFLPNSHNGQSFYGSVPSASNLVVMLANPGANAPPVPTNDLPVIPYYNPYPPNGVVISGQWEKHLILVRETGNPPYSNSHGYIWVWVAGPQTIPPPFPQPLAPY